MTNIQLQLRRDTAANWSANNPVLAPGELGLDQTNQIIKTGDGVTAWNALTAAFYAKSQAQNAVVATSESTTSTSFVDLTTTTDQVTVNIGPSGMAQVLLFSQFVNTGTNYSYVSFAASGANTIAAGIATAINFASPGANWIGAYGAPFLLTGLNPGATTFKMKYSVQAGTGTFSNRRIAVIPL